MFCGMLDDTGDFVSNPILFRVDRSGRWLVPDLMLLFLLHPEAESPA